MATNYISDGNVLDYVAMHNLKSGQLVIIGELAGIALTDIEKGTTGAVQIYGIWELAKAKGEIAMGDKLYLDNANSQLTSVESGNIYVGMAVEASSASSATVKLLLNAR